VNADPVARRARRGYALIAAMVLVAVLIFNLDGVVEWFRGHTDLVALVDRTEGVRVGSPVLVEGVEAGRVTDIRFVDRGPDAAVALSIRLDDRVLPAVRQGSHAHTVKRRLIGQPTVLISAGPTDSPPVEPGDTLYPSGLPSIEELLERGLAFPASLDSLNLALEELGGLVERRRPALRELVDRLAVVTDEATTLRSDLEGGSIARWLEDPELGVRIDRLRRQVAAIGEAVDRLKARADGDDGLRTRLGTVTERADRLAARLDTLGHTIREGDGIVPRMSRDSALAVALAEVTAQIDSLRAEGMGFALRMLLP
jgi:hypothetical protein